MSDLHVLHISWWFFCIFASYFEIRHKMSLSVQNICKSYAQNVVLNEISLELKAGEIVGFLGPNGAGKSTLMKIITGFIQPDSGQVTVCGETVSESNLKTRRLIGYLPEHNPLYLDMYVREYLDFVARFYRLDNRKARIEQMIERTGLTAEYHKRIGELSKGYRQRVGLAQALIHDPQVLILDEPTTGLDPNQLVEIRQLISDIGKEKTVLFSTHIMQEVQALCQRVVVINKGTIVADAAESVISQGSKLLRFEVEFSVPMHHDLAQLSEAILKVDTLSDKLFQISANSDVREHLFRFATEQKLSILTMRQLEESMEDIFRKLTK